jgi:hypothetical protein
VFKTHDSDENMAEFTVLLTSRRPAGTHVWFYDTGDAAGHLAPNTRGATRIVSAATTEDSVAVDAGGRQRASTSTFVDDDSWVPPVTTGNVECVSRIQFRLLCGSKLLVDTGTEGHIADDLSLGWAFTNAGTQWFLSLGDLRATCDGVLAS